MIAQESRGGPTLPATVTLTGPEIRSVGAELLTELAGTAQSVESAPRWRCWDRSKTRRLERLLSIVGAMDAADVAHQPFALDADALDDGIDGLRRLCYQGVLSAREVLDSTLSGAWRPGADPLEEWDAAAETFAALVAVLDRIGWGGESLSLGVGGELPVDAVRGLAERLER